MEHEPTISTHVAGYQTREEYLQDARRYARYRFNRRRAENGYYGHESHDVAAALRDTEKRFVDLDTFGVEGSLEPDMHYLNTGDSYDLTIVYYKGRFMVASWGDLVEKVA